MNGVGVYEEVITHQFGSTKNGIVYDNAVSVIVYVRSPIAVNVGMCVPNVVGGWQGSVIVITKGVASSTMLAGSYST